MAIGPRPIIDITARNLDQVPASRGNYPIEFIVIHYLGVDGQNPDLYGGGYGGHYNIFWDGTIYKAADPRTAVVWQCGGGRQGYDPGSGRFFNICTNFNSIGIENSVHFDGAWYFTTETQESLVYLVSTLMDEYGIPIDRVIRHWDVTGKHCPAPYVENTKHRTSWTWDEFIQKLSDYRSGKGDDDKVISDVFKKERIKKVYKTGKARIVNCDKLNVRLAPSPDAPKHSYWGTLSKNNEVCELARWKNGWSTVYIAAGEGTGTIGYVKSSFLSAKK